jgi:hypothetical protein
MQRQYASALRKYLTVIKLKRFSSLLLITSKADALTGHMRRTK